VPVDNADGQPAPPDTTDTVAVEPNNEATSVPVEQSPKINGHASPDITNPASLSKQDGLEQTEDVPLPDNENNASAGDVEQVEPEDDAALRKEKSNHRRKEPKSTAQENVDERRSLESTTEQQGNMQIETQEPTEPVIPEEPRETAQEETEEQIPEDPRPSSQQPEKRKRGRPPTTARAAPSEDKRTGEEEAHSPEQDSIQTNTARKTGRPRKQRRVSTASPDGEAPGKPDGEADEPEPEPEPEDIEEEHADEAPESPQQPSTTKRKKRIDNEEEPEGENQDSSQQLRRTKQRKRKDDEEGEEDAQDSPQPSRTKQKKRKDNAEEPEDGNQSSLQEPRRTKQKKRKDTDEDQREDEDRDLPERQSSTAKQKGKKPVGRVPIRNNRRSLPAVQVPESLFPSSKKPKEQQRPEAAAAPSEKEDEQAPPAKPRRGRPPGSKNSSRKSTQLTKEERVSSPQAEEQEQEEAEEAGAEAETEVAADKDQEPKPKPKSQRGEAVPVTVHRLANAAALDISFSDSADSEAGEEADSADELATRTKTKFPNRAGVNPADVLAQICRETLDKTLATLKSGIANESNPARRAEWTRKRKAVEAYATELEGRLFEMSEILDSNFLLSVRLRRAKREMAELRARLLQVRRQREEVALRMDEVRRRHAEEEAASMVCISTYLSYISYLHTLWIGTDITIEPPVPFQHQQLPPQPRARPRPQPEPHQQRRRRQRQTVSIHRRPRIRPPQRRAGCQLHRPGIPGRPAAPDQVVQCAAGADGAQVGGGQVELN